jgi:hypothetical protein
MRASGRVVIHFPEEGSLMFSALRRRLTYANVAATLALFFAMTGGALAASHYLITSTKQIKPSVLSALKGKAGAAGANGANGAAGEKGAPGLQGSAGPTGSNGAAGESVVSAALKPKEGGCAEGGTKFTVSGKETTACNGKAGVNGTTGFTETLPPEKTETGAWSFGQVPIGAEGKLNELVPISFNIPLKEELESTHTHYVSKEEQEHANGTEPPQECQGSLAEPKATPGSLCVYEGFFSWVTNAQSGGDGGRFKVLIRNPGHLVALGAATTGALIEATIEAAEEGLSVEVFGTWAVTAPEEEK